MLLKLQALCVWMLIGGSLVIGGCTSRDAPVPTTAESATTSIDPAPPSNPVRAVYEQYRSGLVQLDNIDENITSALTLASQMKGAAKGDLKSALQEACDLIDSAGAGIAEAAIGPPTYELFQKDFAAYDERRLEAIQAANDALLDLRSASGVLADFESVPSPERQDVVRLLDLLATATEDIQDAITSMGGKVEVQI